MSDECQNLDQQRQKRAAEHLPDSPHARPVGELLEELDVDARAGLTSDEARSRRRRFGPNCIRSPGIASP
ncbi:MAG: cation-transporting P-type ATPase, partial [Armatimonadota bacterium]